MRRLPRERGSLLCQESERILDADRRKVRWISARCYRNPDYDPFGWLLLDPFAGDLRTFGIRHPKVINLSVPKNYTPDELAFMHYDLATAADIPKSTIRRWMKKTHGIDGHTWGFEVDGLMMDRERVKRLVLAAGKPYFHPE